MAGRRLLLLVAILMGLTALAASVAPRDPARERRNSAQAPPSPTATPAPAASDARVLRRTLSAGEGARRRDIRVRVGDTLALTVRGDVVDSVQLGDLAVEAVDPEAPAFFELRAETPGTHPIRLLGAERELGRLLIAAPGVSARAQPR
jgi:hypothetical protein